MKAQKQLGVMTPSVDTLQASVAVFILLALYISDVMQFYCRLYLHLLPFAQNNKYTLVASVLDFYYVL